ncbi:MAG: AzlD domain-containing protein [Acidimicrobiales bacterium]
MRIWLILIGAGLITYLTRASFILAGDRIQMPAWAERSLRYVAPASFAAISAPALFGEGGFTGVPDRLPYLIAAVATLLVVHKRRNLPGALVVGMTSLWLLQWAGL